MVESTVSEDLKIANVKGNVFMIQRNYAVAKWGEDIIKKVETDLAAEWLSFISNQETLRMKWVPQTFFSDFYRSLINHVGIDKKMLCKEIGNAVMKNMVNNLMITMFKLGTPNTVAITAATLWSRNYDQGKAIVETSKNQFVFIVKGYRPATEYNGFSLWGGLEAYVEMIGYQVVSSSYDKSVLSGDDCEQYTINWTHK